MTEKLLIDDIAERCKIFDENYAEVTERIAIAAKKSGRRAEDIHLLAATKTIPVEVINHAIKSGVTLIGENRVQELLSKLDYYDQSATRHLIGHLQTNKVRQIVGKVSMIESV
ncbi:MAG: YggS family pyridoxal phosphate-dependent enzyme, partial [Clostridia bacterium]|nr:YggS family pyridoxal phosphate-dependent enzyme [Clostridia bacterium]